MSLLPFRCKNLQHTLLGQFISATWKGVNARVSSDICVHVCVRERWEVSGGRVVVKRGSYKKTSGWISLAALFFIPMIQPYWIFSRWCLLSFLLLLRLWTDCFFFQGGHWFRIMIAPQHTHKTQLYFLKERLEEDGGGCGGLRRGRLHWEDEVRKAEDGGSRCGRLRRQKGTRSALNLLLCPWSRCTQGKLMIVSSCLPLPPLGPVVFQ